MSGFEIITITFSFILGLGVTQILRAVAYVVREREQYQLHWIPISVATMVLLFQVQFWFALVIVDSFVGHWTWTVYGVLLSLAIIIFLSGATVLPPPGPSKTRNLIEDFATRGKISLVFLALYLLGWIVVAIMFWTEAFVHLVIVNSVMATIATIAFLAQNQKARSVLHGMLIVMMIYGLVTVWTPPSLEEPLTSALGG
jgi:hypothetical protein